VQWQGLQLLTLYMVRASSHHHFNRVVAGLSQNQNVPIPEKHKEIDARQVPNSDACEVQFAESEAIEHQQSMKWREMLQCELNAQRLGHSLL